MFYGICFFFFKQETAYEMRISDWSSDVCSSDLLFSNVCFDADRGLAKSPYTSKDTAPEPTAGNHDAINQSIVGLFRSEERRVGKECVRTCRSRWSPSH